MNAVIYARYSSHNQTDQSIEGQLKVCRKYAKDNGYNVIEEYCDKAISGKTDNRPAFQKMIKESSKKKFQYVIVYQLDRFARNRYDNALYKIELQKNNVRVISAKEQISDDASGGLLEGILEAMAQYYSDELSQKIKRGIDINASKCLFIGGSLSLGYKVEKETKKYLVDEETAPIVQKIFELYAEGKSIVEIMNYLNSKNYKTVRDRKFTKSSFERILKNKRYIGTYIYKDKETPNGIPRIITDELFYKVQAKIEENKKAPARAKAKNEYLLTTKLFCGYCKEMMIGISGISHTGKSHSYYSCNGRKTKGCKKKNVRKDLIEDYIVQEAQDILTKENIEIIIEETLDLVKEQQDNSSFKILNKQLTRLEREKSNLVDSLKMCEIPSVKKTIFEEISNLEDEILVLEKEIAFEETQVLNLDKKKIKYFLNQLKNCDLKEVKYRKALITTLVNKIYLYDDKIVIAFNISDTIKEVEISLIEDMIVRFSKDILHHKKIKRTIYYFLGGFAFKVDF